MRHLPMPSRHLGPERTASKGSGLAYSFLFTWMFVVLMLLASSLQARAAEASPSEFLMQLRDRVVAQLAEQGISDSDREKRFKALLRESFDMEGVARFVAGTSWKEAGAVEQEAFTAAFEQSIVRRFLPLLSDSKGNRITFDDATQESGGKILQVKASVQRSDGNATELLWRLRRSEDSYRILDLSAQGISMAITLRDEYASVLKSNGGDLGALAKMLQKKTDSTKG